MKFWELRRDYSTLVSQEKQVLSALQKLTGSNWDCLSRYDCAESTHFAEGQTRVVRKLIDEYFLLQKDKNYIDSYSILDCDGVAIEDVMTRHSRMQGLLDHILFDIGVTDEKDIQVITDHIRSLSKYVTQIKERGTHNV